MPRLDHRPTPQRVREARAAAYPDLGDVVDRLCVAVEALAAGQPLPADVAALLAQRQAVKTRYPKS
ncbi:hypothetical protein [Azospirillum sp. B4]|uniref:hypothetical protein n=1 Tax=Azospirillum sp. B4 TaxID=95605 RepID=UPI00034AA51A|nr:hypothetical protein [Azospirillum sp. B4]